MAGLESLLITYTEQSDMSTSIYLYYFIETGMKAIFRSNEENKDIGHGEQIKVVNVPVIGHAANSTPTCLTKKLGLLLIFMINNL
jgi:hypothetical protein